MPNEKLEKALSLVIDHGVSPRAAAKAMKIDEQELFTRLRELKKDCDDAVTAIKFGNIPKSLLQEQEFFQRKLDREANSFLEKNGFTTWTTKRKG